MYIFIIIESRLHKHINKVSLLCGCPTTTGSPHTVTSIYGQAGNLSGSKLTVFSRCWLPIGWNQLSIRHTWGILRDALLWLVDRVKGPLISSLYVVERCWLVYVFSGRFLISERLNMIGQIFCQYFKWTENTLFWKFDERR